MERVIRASCPLPPPPKKKTGKRKTKLNERTAFCKWISDSKTYCVINRIEIYPVDSVIRPLNNRGLEVITDIDVSFQRPAQQLLEGVSTIRLSKLPQLI